MKRIVLWIAVVAAAAWAQTVKLEGVGDIRPKFTNAKVEERAVSGGLEATLRSIGAQAKGPVWAAYTVRTKATDSLMCCFDSIRQIRDNTGCCGGCRLESDHGINVSRIEGRCAQRPAHDHMFVFFRLESGEVRKVRAFSPDCLLDAGGRSIYWLAPVPEVQGFEDQSIKVLQGLARRGFTTDPDGMGDEALMAMAMHLGDAADRALQELASPGQPEKQREQAAFWLGEERGKRGFEILKSLVGNGSDARFREEATFAISESKEPEALEQLIAMARRDSASRVREQALFWLAEKAGHKAVATITDAMENDPETSVRKKAVFALSEMPPDEGIPLLLKYARSHRDPVVRKEAIFWLGQSGDPRALDFMEEVLLGKNNH